MDWSEVGKDISQYAPLVGMALSSPTGAAVAVGQVVANVLGSKSTPEDVINSFNQDKQKSAQKLQQEISSNIEFQKMCLSKIQEQNRHDEAEDSLIIKDKISSRENSDNINKSPVDNDLKIIIVIGELIMLFFCIIALFIFHEGLDKSVFGILGTVIGIFGKSLSSKDDFYWGSSFRRNDYSS